MSRKTYKHVALIGVDGMGNYNRQANTPEFDKIFKNGAQTYSALSMDPTISAENWGAMLLGADPTVHGLTNSIVDKFLYTNKELPSVFTRLRALHPDAYLAACSNWNPINHGIIEHDIGVDMFTAPNDEELTPLILECVSKKPEFLFVQFDDVDSAGHGKGYGTQGHLDSIEVADKLTGRIYDAYKKIGILDDTLFIVIADHGGIRHGHGGYTDEEKYVFLGVSGSGINKSQIKTACTKDAAAIVLYALGADVPTFDKSGFSSQIPEGIFPEYDGRYFIAEKTVREIATRETPDFHGRDGLASIFGEDNIKLAMFFDNNMNDEAGNCKFTETGTIKYYSTGVYGSRGEFGQTGYALTNDLSLCSQNFTIAVWLKVERRSITEECVVCGTKDWWWQNRNCRGFMLVERNNSTLFSIGNGEENFEVVTPYPDNFSDGWIHITVSVDKTNRELRFYDDFNFIWKVVLEEQFAGDTDAYPFAVGNDAGLLNNVQSFPNTFNMDDLVIFKGAFNDSDVLKLKKYYGSK